MRIALLTDFGAASIFVGQMKAVIASICPGCEVLDLAHDIIDGLHLDVAEDEPCAAQRHFFSQQFAQSLRGAGYQHDLAREVEQWVESSYVLHTVSRLFR